MIKKLFAVQVFRDDKWQTIIVSSDYNTPADVYDECCYTYTEPIRLVWLKVDGVDFVMTHARDFAVVASRLDPA